MAQMLFEDTFVVVHCCDCGVAFAMTADMQARFRRDGGSFYCPSGHSQSYTTPEIVRVRRELESAKKSLDETRAKLADAQLAAERQERRLAAGSCPLCAKKFANLSKHMKEKHTVKTKKKSR